MLCILWQVLSKLFNVVCCIVLLNPLLWSSSVMSSTFIYVVGLCLCVIITRRFMRPLISFHVAHACSVRRQTRGVCVRVCVSLFVSDLIYLWIVFHLLCRIFSGVPGLLMVGW